MSDAIENMISAVEHGANKRGGGVMVKRYDFFADLTHGEITCQRLAASDGGHVEFTDYESLERERDALKDYILSIVASAGRDTPDCIDNDGQPYQSHALDELIRKLESEKRSRP